MESVQLLALACRLCLGMQGCAIGEAKEIVKVQGALVSESY
jgi:hypothetical protein